MRLAVFVALFFLAVPVTHAQSALTITTEPNAAIWIDEIRRGTTDASGKLVVNKVSAGRHSVRVRANGFKESVTPLLPGRRTLAVKLVTTTDPAELKFQEAETAREKARDDPSLQKAADLYRETIKLRSAFPAAHVGLARVLLDLNEFKEAHAEIEAARRTR
ncbi:MAG TPA: tetratricopeptide repeat protein, partial [Pyrinomonadaceae bacterium]|nr:tetratricopeptide repeat protein [Pyrinomonadaceae bacterium]